MLRAMRSSSFSCLARRSQRLYRIMPSSTLRRRPSHSRSTGARQPTASIHGILTLLRYPGGAFWMICSLRCSSWSPSTLARAETISSFTASGSRFGSAHEVSGSSDDTTDWFSELFAGNAVPASRTAPTS